MSERFVATRQTLPTMKSPLILTILRNRFPLLRRMGFFRKRPASLPRTRHSLRIPSEVPRLPSHSTDPRLDRNSRLPNFITLSHLPSAAELGSLLSPRRQSLFNSQTVLVLLKVETTMNLSLDSLLENDTVHPKLSKENLQSSSSLLLRLAPPLLTTILCSKTSSRPPWQVTLHQLLHPSNSPQRLELLDDLPLS